MHVAANKVAKAGALLKRLRHERIVQSMELLILDAQIAKLTGYIDLVDSHMNDSTSFNTIVEVDED